MNRLWISLGMLLGCGAPPTLPQASLSSPVHSSQGEPARSVTTLALGSCNNQTGSQDYWKVIAEQRPEAFLMLGDNVYGDLADDSPSGPGLPELEAAYTLQNTHSVYQDFRESTPFYTTWDDHDYGVNDAGGDFAFRSRAEHLFLDFWDADAEDPRRTREGIYHHWFVESQGHSIQLIALDTRSFRSPLTIGPEGGAKYPARVDGQGTILGEDQWVWLESALQRPADLRIVMSSIQVISTHHGWERWDTMPHERQRLLNLVHDADAWVVSGDRHLGGVYWHEQDGHIIYELTSSALNQTIERFISGEGQPEQDPNRLQEAVVETNFGWMNIDWANGTVEVSLRSARTGDVLQSHMLPLSAEQSPLPETKQQ